MVKSMISYNKNLINSLFGGNKNTEPVSHSSVKNNTAKIITGVALEDSSNGQVYVQIGDPVVRVLYEEDYDDTEVDLENYELSINMADDDDDDDIERLEEDVVGDDDGEFDGEIPDNIDMEGNVLEDPVEVSG